MALSFQIKKEFQSITGFELPDRETNFLSDGMERKDMVFENISRLCFDKPVKAKLLGKKIKNWLALAPDSEELLGLAGFLCYIDEDFAGAERYFLAAIVENPDNYDSWRDLAFAWRHNKKKELSKVLIFNFPIAMYYYKRLGIGADKKKLEKLIREIQKKTDEAGK